MATRTRSVAVAGVIGIALAVGSLAVQVAPTAGAISPTSASTQTHYWSEVHTAAGTRVEGKSLARLSDDTVVITGNFTSQAIFPTGPSADDSIVLISAGGFDIFVAQLDTSTGYFTWAQRAGGSVSDIGYGVAASTDDTAIVTGSFQGTSRFPTGPNADDSIVVPSNGDQDIFVAALDTSTGFFTWAQRAGGPEVQPSPGPTSEDAGYSLAVRDDTVIVTGEFEGTADFPTGPNADDSIVLSSDGNSDVFVAGVNPGTGFFTWAQRAGGSSSDEGRSVAITSDGRPVLTGRVSSMAYFPSGPGDDSIAVAGQGSDIFVAGMNADDSYFDWVQLAGGAGLDEGLSLALTGDDTPILTGRFVNAATFPTGPNPGDTISLAGDSSDVFLAAINADDSYFAWAQRATGPNTDYGIAVALTAAGDPVITGFLTDSLTFPTGAGSGDSITLSSAGGSDVYVAGFNPTNGYFTWAQQAGGTGSDAGRAIAILADGTPLATGNFAGTASFPSGPSAAITRTAQPAGAEANLFIGQLVPFTPDPTPPAPAFPPSAPRDVAAEPGDASVQVSWTAPSSPGSFPITNYQVQIQPGATSCLVSATARDCTISGLTNGTTYTASVRALNGAGWSSYSAASEPFTPQAPIVQSIMISGSRAEVRGRPGVVVRGETTGLVGRSVTSMVSLRGQTSYTAGSPRVVDDQGSFTWQRRTGRKVYVYFTHESTRSNRVIIRAR